MLFSRDYIDTVEAAADIVTVILECGIDLKKEGANYKGLCPFHSEKSASFKVTPDKGFFHCFGCRAGGRGAIKFLMLYEKIPFREAVIKLADRFNIPIENSSGKDENVKSQTRGKVERKLSVVPPRPKPEPGPTLSNKQKHEIYSHLIFNCGLGLSDQGQQYLEGRAFDIHHCLKMGLRDVHSSYHDKFLLEFLLRKLTEQFTIEDLHLAGLVNEKGNFRLFNRVLIPCYWKGQLLMIQGRQIEDNDNFPKYLNTGTMPPYYDPPNPIQNPELWIVEGALNSISAMGEGLRSIAILTASNKNNDEIIDSVVNMIMEDRSIKSVVFSADEGDRGGVGVDLMKSIARKLRKAGFPLDQIKKDHKKGAKDFNDYQQMKGKS